MHLYIATRGQKNLVDNFINDLQAQFFTYKANPHSVEPDHLQLGVRPIQIWEIAFPKEHLNEVLATIGGARPKIQDKRMFVKILALILSFKRLLGWHTVPDIDPKTPRRLVRKDFVDVKLLGIKDDGEGRIELV